MSPSDEDTDDSDDEIHDPMAELPSLDDNKVTSQTGLIRTLTLTH